MAFSLADFKTQASLPLTKFEFEFISKTFGKAAGFFACFGGLVWVTSMALGESLSSGRSSIAYLLTMGLMFGLMFFSSRYSADPVGADQNTVNGAYGLLVASYLAVFTLFLSFLDIGKEAQGGLIALIFGLSVVIYMIPAVIGLFMKDHFKVLSLKKLLSYCYMAYMVLFAISLLTFFLGGLGTKGSQAILIPIYLLFTVISLLSPILTFYRMKKVVAFLDPMNTVELEKWRKFFVFEILFQMMQIALHLLRLLMLFFGGRRGS